MLISIDTEKPGDVDLLKTLVGVLAGEAPVTPAPAKKAAAAPAKKAAAAPAPEPEPEATGPSMDDAVALATQLVADGYAAQVKAALGEFSAERVSKLAAGDIGGFMAKAEELVAAAKADADVV